VLFPLHPPASGDRSQLLGVISHPALCGETLGYQLLSIRSREVRNWDPWGHNLLHSCSKNQKQQVYKVRPSFYLIRTHTQTHPHTQDRGQLINLLIQGAVEGVMVRTPSMKL